VWFPFSLTTIPSDDDNGDDDLVSIPDIAEVTSEGGDGDRSLRCSLAPKDEFPVLLVGCLMSLAQGSSMVSFLGSIGYFSHRYTLPQLVLYATIAQSLITPAILDLQRRFDHVFDKQFGLKATFLFRIGGLSLLQILLLISAPYLASPISFLTACSLSATIFIAVYSQVVMVVSCVDGAQAVNFARTASHAGGVVVLLFVWIFDISTKSQLPAVMGFFASAVGLQLVALAAWLREHAKNESLTAAYAVIAEQQAYSAMVAVKKSMSPRSNSKKAGGGYTLLTMFGSNHSNQGLVLLLSFGIVQATWSYIQSVLNVFGNEDFTQWLVLLSYPADLLGRLVSHVAHGCASSAILKVPLLVYHCITAAAALICVVLTVDASLKFLPTAYVSSTVCVLCCMVAFNLNELAVQSIHLAKCRSQVAHCQNYVFFSATELANIAALCLQLCSGYI